MSAAAPDPAPSTTPAATPPVDEHRPWVTNLVLLTLVIALGLWVWQGDSHTKSTALLEREKGKVFRFFQPADVSRLAITRGEGPQVVLTPSGAAADGKGRTWQVVAPVEDRADDAVVREVLSAMEWLEHQAVVEGDALAEYPFGAVAGQVLVERAGRPPLAFEVGAARGGVVPLRRIDPEAPAAVFHVPEAFAARALREPNAFRSKELFSPDVRQAEGLAVSATPRGEGPAPRREVTLTRADGLWRVAGAGGDPTGDLASRPLVSALLDAASGLRAVAIAADPAADEAYAAYGLADPADGITARSGESVRSLWLGDAVPDRPGARYARLSDRRPVYVVQPASLTDALGRAAQQWLAPELFPATGGLASVTGFGAKLEGGPELRLQRDKEGVWRFEGEAKVPAATPAVEQLLEALLGLRVAERLDGAQDRAARGLDTPAVRIEVVQDRLRQEVWIGEPVVGQPGVHYAGRLLPPPSPAGSLAAYTVDVGPIAATLRAAPLELLDRRIFKASSWDARELTLTEPDGRVSFRAAKVNPNPDDPNAPKVWRVDGVEGDVEERLRPLLEALDEVYVDRYVARTDADDEEAVLARYGLEAPRLLTVGVEVFRDGALAIEPRTLRLGRREGERMYAASDDVPAVGVIAPLFLDRIARGFARGTVLFELDKWDARRLTVEQDGAVVLDVRKPDLNWKRGVRIVERPEQVEDLIEKFEHVEVSRTEAATPELLKERGLARPELKVTIVVGQGEGEKEHVLLIGGPAGARERWATTPGGEVIGRFFDAPLTGNGGLEEYLRTHPDPEAPFPPKRG